MITMPKKTNFADGSVLTILNLGGYEVLVYQPVCEKMPNYINYGFSGPLLLVFGDGCYTPASAKAFCDSKGLSAIAASQGTSVSFVNPKTGADWKLEASDAYQTIIANTHIGQRTHYDGILTLTDRKTGEFLSYSLLGSPARSYVYAIGSGADYIAANCLKKMEHASPFGLMEITMAGCTLERLSTVPTPEKYDIPMVSIGNSPEINEQLSLCCGSVLVSEAADYPLQFREQIGKHKRWKGKLMKADNPEWESIHMEPGSITVNTTQDNAGFFRESKTHPVHYVAFYDEDLDVHSEKVPLVLCFHGGGDSALCTTLLAGWHTVAKENRFLLVAVELHLDTTATEIKEFIAHLQETYSIDPERIYATGFSMGGCKSWDLYQECPEIFAALAPMDATFGVGLNQYGLQAPHCNEDVMVPIFYVGGEISPLPELPFHEQKCIDRMAYVMKVNKTKRNYAVCMEEKSQWVNPFFGIDGDIVYKISQDEEDPESILSVHLYESESGKYYTAFASASRQAHDVKLRNSRAAWDFIKQFRRTKDGFITVEPVSYHLKSDDSRIINNQYNTGD